jgi:DNA-binding CsgD family transcriptional regulator
MLGLSNRESEVLHWIAQGKSNLEVAYILKISVGTIKKHIANIFDKFGVKTRVAATMTALEMIQGKEGTLMRTVS